MLLKKGDLNFGFAFRRKFGIKFQIFVRNIPNFLSFPERLVIDKVRNACNDRVTRLKSRA